jgi:uncharacterized RDD family membrane protein YckC
MGMHWYYASEGTQLGPFQKEQIDQLVLEGKITSETLVWHEGMEDWRPYGRVKAQDLPPAPPQAETPASASTETCSECGRSFAEEDILRYRQFRICASCKPAFFQKLKQGVRLPGIMEFGGFWPRFFAKMIDGILVGIVYFIFSVLISLAVASNAGRQSMPMVIATLISLFAVQLGLSTAYSIWFVGKYGATPGKMALSLTIVTGDGGKLSYGMATKRFFAEMLSAFTMYIGYLLALFDEEKRTLHDRICDTRVIRK